MLTETIMAVEVLCTSFSKACTRGPAYHRPVYCNKVDDYKAKCLQPISRVLPPTTNSEYRFC